MKKNKENYFLYMDDFYGHGINIKVNFNKIEFKKFLRLIHNIAEEFSSPILQRELIEKLPYKTIRNKLLKHIKKINDDNKELQFVVSDKIGDYSDIWDYLNIESKENRKLLNL